MRRELQTARVLAESRSSGRNTRGALFLSLKSTQHHFGDVPKILKQSGWDVRQETEQDRAPLVLTPTMLDGVHLVCHTDGTNTNSREIYQQCQRYAIPTALQMDGVVEYANTFLNPKSGHAFLRPAPAEFVCAASSHDQRILQSLGNQTIATGLPRLDGFANAVEQYQKKSEPIGVLVATANEPACTKGGRQRVLEELASLKAALKQRAVPVRWRISHEFAKLLSVQRDESPLVESMASTCAVLTTVSTLAIESMLANLPTAIIHPHPWPLWIPSAWIWNGSSTKGVQDDCESIKALRGVDAASSRVAEESMQGVMQSNQPCKENDVNLMLDSLLEPDQSTMSLQSHIRKIYSTGCASQSVVDVLQEKAYSSSVSLEKCVPDISYPATGSTLERAVHEAIGNGFAKICILTSRSKAAGLAATLAPHMQSIAGFVIANASPNAQYLGKPVWSHKDGLDPNHVDCLLIDECLNDIYLQLLRHSYLSGEPPPCFQTDICVRLIGKDQSNMNHLESVFADIKARRKQGNILTTLEPGFINAQSVRPTESNLPKASMLILRGGEDDFSHYAQLKKQRQAGLLIRSLVWSDAELTAPQRFAALIKDNKISHYAIFGAGRHTVRLLLNSEVSIQPSCILDDHAIDGMEIWGIPVLHPISFSNSDCSNIEAIIISSCQYQSELTQNCKAHFGDSIQIYHLYDSISMTAREHQK